VLPFEGFRRGGDPWQRRRCRGCLSGGSLRFRVLMCARLVGVIGYPLPSCPHHFWWDFTVFTRHRPPLSCETGFILSYALRLFRVLPSLPAPGSPLSESLNTRERARGAPSVGLRALIATSASSVVTAKFHLRRHPSSAFRTPSTVCSATDLAGLFHPAATSRVLPSRAFPSQHSRTDSSSIRALSSVGHGRLRAVARPCQLP